MIKGQQRGNYSITANILQKCEPQISKVQSGECHLFLLHTSAGLSLGNFTDPRQQVVNARLYQAMVPYSKDFQHNYAGEDDMTSHGLCNIMGVSLTLPIVNGALQLG